MAWISKEFFQLLSIMHTQRHKMKPKKGFLAAFLCLGLKSCCAQTHTKAKTAQKVPNLLCIDTHEGQNCTQMYQIRHFFCPYSLTRIAL